MIDRNPITDVPTPEAHIAPNGLPASGTSSGGVSASPEIFGHDLAVEPDASTLSILEEAADQAELRSKRAARLARKTRRPSMRGDRGANYM